MTETEIRPAIPGDASALLEPQRALDRETDFMLLEPGEREADRRVGEYYMGLLLD